MAEHSDTTGVDLKEGRPQPYADYLMPERDPYTVFPARLVARVLADRDGMRRPARLLERIAEGARYIHHGFAAEYLGLDERTFCDLVAVTGLPARTLHYHPSSGASRALGSPGWSVTELAEIATAAEQLGLAIDPAELAAAVVKRLPRRSRGGENMISHGELCCLWYARERHRSQLLGRIERDATVTLPDQFEVVTSTGYLIQGARDWVSFTGPLKRRRGRAAALTCAGARS